MQSPIKLFNQWYTEELANAKVKIPSACCLSTVGEDGYPNSRFVSLKEVKNNAFIITGPLNSRKGKEINLAPKVSISFWWTATQRQVRIQGNATEITKAESNQYFSKRSQDSKIVSTVFNQGEEIASIKELKSRFYNAQLTLKHQSIEKPAQWSGFRIHPIRVEFMEFKTTRLHERRRFEKNEGTWVETFLQP